MKIAVAAVVAVLLTGCVGPNPNLGITNFATMPTPIRRQVDAVSIVATVPAGSTIIGSFEGNSCRNKLWDKEPTEADALEQLRIRAGTAGGTGVAGVSYSKAGTSMMTNCWSTITATGTVFR